MNSTVIALFVAILATGCQVKKFPLLTKDSDNNNQATSNPTPSAEPTPSSEAPMDPIVVTGVYLACSPAVKNDSSESVACLVADNQQKKKIDLGMIMNRWNFNVDQSSISNTGVTAQLSQDDSQYHFKLSLSGATPEIRDAALRTAQIALDYSTKSNNNSQVKYTIGESSSTGDISMGGTGAASKMGPITGTPLKSAMSITQNEQTGVAITQQIPPDAQNIQLVMQGWPLPTADHPIAAGVYFGVPALMIHDLSIGYTLSFDHGAQHCAGIINFLPTDKGSDVVFDCH